MNSNPTILISINTSWNIYHFRASLIHALKAKGYDIVSAAPDDVYTPRLKALVDRHIHLPIHSDGTSPLQDLVLFWEYLQLLRRLRPTVLLTYTIKPNIYGALAARMLGIPVIANVSGLGTAFLRNDWLTGLVKLLYKVAFRGADRVFFQNPQDRDLFLKMHLVAPHQSVLVMGSGVDLEHFKPSIPTPKSPSEPLAFVLIARLLWDKGISEYVEAARIVKATYPHTLFRLVGPKGVQNQTAIPDYIIDEWVAEGVIEYWTEVEDVREVIVGHDAVVLPSYREGLSRVLLEAAAMGKPVIVSDVPGCTETVEPEKTGLLCEVKDAHNLADCMIRFICMSDAARAEMGRAGRVKAEREFDQQQVLDTYLQEIAAVTI